MKCKFYKPEMDELRKLCNDFYKLPGCAAGGPLHILLDDCNFKDEDIDFCITECSKDVYPEIVRTTGINICNKYKQFSLVERAIFDTHRGGWNSECIYTQNCKCIDCTYIREISIDTVSDLMEILKILPPKAELYMAAVFASVYSPGVMDTIFIKE